MDRHANSIVEMTNEKKSRDALMCLKNLFLLVYGMKMKRHSDDELETAVSKGRRMKEV